MGTRFYLESSGSAPVTPASWSVDWEKTSGAAADAPLTTTKTGSSSATNANAGNGAAADVAVRRFISPALAAQTISGTCKGQIRCAEQDTPDNYGVACAIKVIKADGTDRGILSIAQGPGSSEMVVDTLTNRKLKKSTDETPLTLSSVVVSNGDYLVFEAGFRQDGTATSLGTLSFGSDNGTDLPEDELETSAFNPWIEFSGTIELAPPPDNIPSFGVGMGTAPSRHEMVGY